MMPSELRTSQHISHLPPVGKVTSIKYCPLQFIALCARSTPLRSTRNQAAATMAATANAEANQTTQRSCTVIVILCAVTFILRSRRRTKGKRLHDCTGRKIDDGDDPQRYVIAGGQQQLGTALDATLRSCT